MKLLMVGVESGKTLFYVINRRFSGGVGSNTYYNLPHRLSKKRAQTAFFPIAPRESFISKLCQIRSIAKVRWETIGEKNGNR